MAKKKVNPLEDPPTASSSDEDELEVLSADDEEEQISDDSSSDGEDDLMKPFKIPSAEKSKSGSTKPVALASPKENSIGGSSAVKKRPIEKTSSKEVNAKRAKKVLVDSENKVAEETKKPLFQRLWSEEDEISLLQGMINFKADTGKSPYEDMDSFYELTSISISFEASKIQFVDKIRSLKRKYMGKVKQGVESLPKAHDIECLKLAKYIWGSYGMALDSNLKKSEKKLEKPHGKEVVEEELLAPESAARSNGASNKSAKRPISGGANGEKDIGVLVNGDNVEQVVEVLVSGDKVEEDREVSINGDNGGEDREVLAGGDKVDETLINGGGASKSHGVRASDWFEDSFLVETIAGLGVSEQFVKQKWRMVTVETKKRMEEKWNLLQAKQMELVLHKTEFMREIGAVIAEAS